MVPLVCVSQYSRACGRATLDLMRRVDCNWMYSSDSSTHLAFSLINDSNEMQLAISCRPTERFSTFAEGLHWQLPPPSPAPRRCEKSDPSTCQAHSAPLDKKGITGPPGSHIGMILAATRLTICDIRISKGTATGEHSDSPMQMWRAKKTRIHKIKPLSQTSEDRQQEGWNYFGTWTEVRHLHFSKIIKKRVEMEHCHNLAEI